MSATLRFGDQEFWSKFSTDFWGHRPTIIENGPSIDPDALLRAVRVASTASDPEDQPLKFYINGRRVRKRIRSYLPSTDEATCEAYWHRLHHKHHAHSFLLYWHDLRGMFSQTDSWAAGFLDGMKANPSVPPPSLVIPEAWFGVYGYTFGGVHQEAFANLQVVLHGVKTMRVWPPATWEQKQERGLHQPCENTGTEIFYLKDVKPGERTLHALDLTATVGQVIYWPSNWWHIGTSPDLTVAVTFSVYD